MKKKKDTEVMIGIAMLVITLTLVGILIIAKRPTNEVPTSTITCSLEPIATPTPTPTATAEPVKTSDPTATPVKYFGPDANEFRNEIEALARVCDAEASVCDENGRRAVIDTVLNRVSSGQFRHTIVEECESDDFQYSKRDWDEIDERIRAYAEEELIKWIQGEDLILPSDYFYFWGNHGMDENGNPTEWKNYFYNDYDLWDAERHITTEHAYKF